MNLTLFIGPQCPSTPSILVNESKVSKCTEPRMQHVIFSINPTILIAIALLTVAWVYGDAQSTQSNSLNSRSTSGCHTTNTIASAPHNLRRSVIREWCRHERQPEQSCTNRAGQYCMVSMVEGPGKQLGLVLSWKVIKQLLYTPSLTSHYSIPHGRHGASYICEDQKGVKGRCRRPT